MKIKKIKYNKSSWRKIQSVIIYRESFYGWPQFHSHTIQLSKKFSKQRLLMLLCVLNRVI